MRKFLTWVIVFIVGLLVGFVPQYWKAQTLRGKLNSCTATVDLSKVQQSAALTYVAATQLNYGVASGYAQTFFASAQALQGSTTDASVRDVLSQALAARDKITGDLAKGSADVVGELQPLVTKLEQAQ
ncbi:MAG TPA: hypothetical protein VFM77_09790 [Terriglobales bacterium]|nr:hypothetical protein [Terriglobales bacterium]